jgi:predicted permease
MKHFIKFILFFTAVIFLGFALDRVIFLIILNDFFHQKEINPIIIIHIFDLAIIISALVVLLKKYREDSNGVSRSAFYSLRYDIRKLLRLPPP